MKTKKYIILFVFLLLCSKSIFAFNATKSVLSGDGTINLYKGGKNVLSTTNLNAGDTLIVFASPAESEALSFLMIGDNIYYSSPISVRITGNIDIQAGFETKKIIFKETFGIAENYISEVIGSNAYSGYDTPSSIAEFSIITGTATNTKIHNIARQTTADNYSEDSINNPHSTHLYLQNSHFAVRFAEGKELVGENIQIKFRYLPVQYLTNPYYDYTSLQVKLNNTSFNSLEYGNKVITPLFWNNTDNPNDPESTNLTGSITGPHRAPFIIFSVPSETYSSISAIFFTQTQQTTPYNNRGRLDDLIIVADSDDTSTESGISKVLSVYAVVTDIDIILKGNLKNGEKALLYNLGSGTVVKTQSVISNSVYISTSELPTGIYAALVKDADGEINTFKLFVK